ncbi:hypothetical protein ACIBK9_28715 [Nonomuraea sp. NPDC050227]|uniref:hypothetical protein n=1 Tax=Nonomuraea sp. NPDC050227 TaxID=3364360 RepID=UPI0037B27779
MLSELATYRVDDWNDIEKTHTQNLQFLVALAADKQAMGVLVDRVVHDSTLRDMCEHNRTLDKLVLHDAPERGFRIRLHLWSDKETGHPHNHRWSFTTLLLTGHYDHVFYRTTGGYETLDPSELTADGGLPRGRDIQVHETFRTTERAGDSYTLHHDIVHCTTTMPQTITLMVRGPVAKANSLTTDPETGRFWFGLGRQRVSATEAKRRVMRDEQYDFCRSELLRLGVIV